MAIANGILSLEIIIIKHNAILYQLECTNHQKCLYTGDDDDDDETNNKIERMRMASS